MTDQIRAILDRAGVEPVSPGGLVWDLKERGCLAGMLGLRSTLTPDVREEVVRAILAGSQSVFLCGGEHLDEDCRSRGWSTASPGVWLLDERMEGASVLECEEVRYGNWTLLAASEPPAQRVPDLLRATEADVMRFMRENGVLALVDSFHDDVEWRVAVAPAGSPSDEE